VLPLLVGERCSLGAECRDTRPGAIHDCCLSAEDAFGGSTRLSVAGGDGLVRPSPYRPSESEGPLHFFRLGQREYQAANLRHGARNQARVEIPFLPTPSSRRAARRMTTRKA
jgi:hypothetical protein